MRVKLIVCSKNFNPSHGPQTWPWWRLFGLLWCEIITASYGSVGHRLWIYTRWRVVHIDFYEKGYQ